MELGISGKIALITGADSGIGWETARVLLEEGATVILTDKYPDKLTQAVEKLGHVKNVFSYPGDITSIKDLKTIHQKIAEEVGKIDILVQSSGITGAQGLFHELDDEGWTNTIEVDLLGPVRLVKEFLPDLRTGGWGRLVFLASEDAVQPYVMKFLIVVQKPVFQHYQKDFLELMLEKDCQSTLFHLLLLKHP